MKTFYEFPTAQAARDHRRDNGPGGWIFEPDDIEGAPTILFPWNMTPSQIFNHPLAKGRSGRLIGHG